MIKNCTEASDRVLEIHERLETGEITPEQAKAYYKGPELYAKFLLIEIKKHQIKVALLPNEKPSKEDGKIFVKKVK
jgi:hypothetical protein